MRKSFFILLLVPIVLVSLVGSSCLAESNESLALLYTEINRRFSCGELALLDTYALVGGSVTPKIIRLLSDFAGFDHSVRDLETIGSILGLQLDSFMANAEALKGIPTPFIAHLKTKHFLTVSSVAPERIEVLDIGGHPAHYSWEEFRNVWSGVVMVPRKSPTDPGLGCLTFAQPSQHLGTLPTGFITIHQLVLKNLSDRKLCISTVAATPGVRVVTATEELSIGPRDQRDVEISMSPGDVPGFKRFLICISTRNDRAKCYFYGVYYAMSIISVRPRGLRIVHEDPDGRLLGNTIYMHIFDDRTSEKIDLNLVGLPGWSIQKEWIRVPDPGHESAVTGFSVPQSTFKMQLVPNKHTQICRRAGHLEIRLVRPPKSTKHVPVEVFPGIWP